MPDPEIDEWKPWAKHVILTIDELKLLANDLRKADADNCNLVLEKIHQLELKLTDRISAVGVRVSVIEAKSAVLGGIAGLAVVIIIEIGKHLTKGG